MENTQLSAGNTVVSNVQDSTSAFAAEVEKSKQAILSADTPPKRGRGRPPGSGKKNPELHVVDSTPHPAVESPKSPPPDISRFLVAPITMVSKIPAQKYGIPELAFSLDEAGMCAAACNELLAAFVPTMGEMSPKTAAIITFGATVGSIGFQKYQIYLGKIAEIRAKTVSQKNTDANSEPAPEGPTFPTQTVNAADHFRKAAGGSGQPPPYSMSL